ncbi:hypothetical protein D3C81_1596710 [compost metagenome]
MGVDRGKGREQLDEAEVFTIAVPGKKNHRFIPGEALGDESARLRKVRRLLVEHPVGVKQRGDLVDVRCVGAQGLNSHEGAPLRSQGITD